MNLAQVSLEAMASSMREEMARRKADGQQEDPETVQAADLAAKIYEQGAKEIEILCATVEMLSSSILIILKGPVDRDVATAMIEACQVAQKIARQGAHSVRAEAEVLSKNIDEHLKGLK